MCRVRGSALSARAPIRRSSEAGTAEQRRAPPSQQQKIRGVGQRARINCRGRIVRCGARCPRAIRAADSGRNAAGAGKAMRAHKRRIGTERSCAIGGRPLSHKRTLLRQRWNGTGVHDDAHRHKGEGESEEAAQQRRSGRAPESAPRIGPAMKGQFHRSRSFSPKTWSYMNNQDDDTVW